MPRADPFSAVVQAVKDFVLDLLGVPEVVYHAVFTQGGPTVMINTVGIGAWVVGTTSAGSENPDPPRGPLAPLAGDALQLRVTRPQPPPGADPLAGDKPSAAVQCVVPIPRGLSGFTLIANYDWIAYCDSPMHDGDLWAPVLVARDGMLQDIDPDPGSATDPIVTKTKIVGATHQFRRQSGAQMISLGVARAAAVPTTVEPVDIVDAYPESQVDRSFTLETDVDCASGNGWSRMRTRHRTWTERPWTHTFLWRPESGSGITGVGVGLAIANGSGTAHARVFEFWILRWRRMPTLWRPIAARLARFRELGATSVHITRSHRSSSFVDRFVNRSL
jgi:hypothetical protein